jgi:hypothetical protein
VFANCIVMIHTFHRIGRYRIIPYKKILYNPFSYKAKPKVNSVYIDLLGTLDEKDFIDTILTGLTQIESKLERILKQMAGLKVSGSIDPVTHLPTLSASIKPREKAEYLEKALNLMAFYSSNQKLIVVFDEFQEVAKCNVQKMASTHILKCSFGGLKYPNFNFGN